MRFAVAASLLVSTAWATMHEPQVVQVTQTVHEVKTVVSHNMGQAAPVMHESSSSAMMHAQPSPAMVHESAPVMHSSTVQEQQMVHTTAPAKYDAVVNAPAAGEPMKHTVTVGGPGGLIYTPEQIQASVGDIVHFIFLQQNHSVTESTFALPCNKKPETVNDSGLLPNPNGTVVPAPTWEYTVVSTEPSWWYCKQRTGSHCGKGMVFAINPTVEKSYNAFKMKAMELNGTATATSASLTATPVSSTVTLDAGLVPSQTAAPGAPPSAAAPPIAVGWNAGGAAQCNCACFCGVGSFAAPGQGSGSFGGTAGTLPSPWAPTKARRRLA
jgi:plastocyanin